MDDFNIDIDPEAGVPAGDFSGIGRVDYSTGEGAPQMRRMDYYQQLGQQLRTALEGPREAPIQAQGGLTSGFNQDWLGQALSAGSANGAHL